MCPRYTYLVEPHTSLLCTLGAATLSLSLPHHMHILLQFKALCLNLPACVPKPCLLTVQTQSFPCVVLVHLAHQLATCAPCASPPVPISSITPPRSAHHHLKAACPQHFGSVYPTTTCCSSYTMRLVSGCATCTRLLVQMVLHVPAPNLPGT